MLSGKAGPCCCGTIFKSAEPESGGHFRLIGSKDRGTVGISILHCMSCDDDALVKTNCTWRFTLFYSRLIGKVSQNESSNDSSMSNTFFLFSSSKILFSSFVWMVGPDFIWPAETRQNEAALPAAVNAAGPPLIRDDADASRTCVRTRETHGDCKVRHQLTKDVVWKGVKVSSWALYLFSLKGFSCGVLELVADIPLELLREANDDSQTSFTSCLTAPSLWWIHVRWQIH